MPPIVPMSALLSTLRGAGRQQLTASAVGARQMITGSHVLRLHGYTQVIKKKFPTGQSLESTTFRVGGHDWRVSCYPNGYNSAYRGYTSLFLESLSPPADDEAPTARLEASVLDRAGKPCHTQDTEPWTFSHSKGWGWKDFVKNDDLSLVDDCLTVLCDVTVQDLPLRAEDVTASHLEPEPMAAALPPFKFDERGQQHEGPIWKRQPTDVTIHVGGETFAAHRSMLEAWSPVFKAELERATTWGDLHVDGVDAQVFKVLLQFMYADALPSDWLEVKPIMLERLLVAADRYGLKKLKLWCEEALCTRGGVDMDSVAAMLTMVERHGCADLKEACMKFLSSDGNLTSFMATDGFERLKKDCPSAAVDIEDIVAEQLRQ